MGRWDEKRKRSYRSGAEEETDPRGTIGGTW